MASKVGLDDYLVGSGDPDDLISNATPADELATVGNTAKARITQLAELTELEYEQCRDAAAEELGVRKLDAFVAEAHGARRAAQPQASPQWAALREVHDEPVDGQALLAELVDAIRLFVIIDRADAVVVALWILFTWVFEHIAETNPFLRIISPTPGCGKSTLLKVILRLARTGWLVSRITASAFVRGMDAQRRTLLLDEGDAFLAENEAMRNVLDGASDPDTANVSFSIQTGDTWSPVTFNAFVPIVIASIGALRRMETVEDRSIATHLKRAKGAELKPLLKGRRRELIERLAPIAPKCARWATDHAVALKAAPRPIFPDHMLGREQDKYEPLMLIAKMIGDDCATEAMAIAVRKSKIAGDDSKTLSVLLLADIKAIFAETGAKAFSSAQLCEALVAIEGRRWAEYGRVRRPISQNQLAFLLKPFLIASHTIPPLPDGSKPRGYELKDFADAFDRYFPDQSHQEKNDDVSTNPSPDIRGAETSGAQGESEVSQSAEQKNGGTLPNASKLNVEKGFGSSADQIPRYEHANTKNVNQEDTEDF